MYGEHVNVTQMATLTHGYSLDRVDRLAHRAAAMSKRFAGGLIDPVEAREEAWQAIVELLYLLPEKPVEWSLVEAGARAVNRRVELDVKHQGRRPAEGGGFEDAPRAAAFWVHLVGSHPDWTDSLVERMALPQILGVLTPGQYQAVAALAAHGSGPKAASALHIEYDAFKRRIQDARKRMLKVWFEGETPHRTEGDLSRRCRNGHSRAEHGFSKPDGRRGCRLCERNSDRRFRARGGGKDDVLEVVDEAVQPAQLTFAPPPEDITPVGVRHHTRDGDVLGSSACWCGLAAGHDWPHKAKGAPHPRFAVAV